MIPLQTYLLSIQRKSKRYNDLPELNPGKHVKDLITSATFGKGTVFTAVCVFVKSRNVGQHEKLCVEFARILENRPIASRPEKGWLTFRSGIKHILHVLSYFQISQVVV